MDGIISASFGRACAIHDEECECLIPLLGPRLIIIFNTLCNSFDLDLPIDCDDEYWNTDHPNPDERFKQPKDKPSLIASFTTLIKLNGILGLALRTIVGYYSFHLSYSIFLITYICHLVLDDKDISPARAEGPI